MTMRNIVLTSLLLVGVAVGVRDLLRSDLWPLDRQMLDFRVFYCGGRAVDLGADPYRIEPARSCEHQYPERLLGRSRNLVLPYVLPAYDSIPFGLLAKLPFPAAERVFTILTILALGASAYLIARTLAVPIPVSVAAVALSTGLPSLLLGQLAPLELLALACTAALLQARREVWAGVAASTLLLEPHVGIFVVAAIAALVPGARLSLAACCAALVLASLAYGGPESTLAYFTQALPGHAFAEARAEEQYSLTRALTLMHVPDATALAIGELWTLGMIGLAIAVAGALKSRGERAALAFVPAAFAVIGGTFVHITQEGLAVPAALWLVKSAPTRNSRRLAGAGLVLLAIPWPYPAHVKGLLLLALVTCAMTTSYVFRGALRPVIACVAVCFLCLWWVENHQAIATPVPQVSAWAPAAPISLEWRQAMDSSTLVDAFHVGQKLPTWLGLGAVLCASLSFLPDSRRLSTTPLLAQADEPARAVA